MKPGRRCNYAGLLVLLLALSIATLCAAAPQVSSLTVTDTDGNPLPARVTLTRVGTPTPDIYVFFTDREGLCRVDSCPAGEATVEVTHGPEWSIETSTVEVVPGSAEKLSVKLQRLFDLNAQGYFAGDGHLHSTSSDGKQTPAEVAHHCRCEGLNWAFLTDHRAVRGHAEFLAQAAPGFLPLGGQEVTTRLGHILGLGTTAVISDKTDGGSADIARIMREIHEQGGMAVIAHPMTPTMSYTQWDVMDFDAIEILNGSLPPYRGLFDLVQARTRWHQLLNEGKHIPAVGDSDNHDNTNGMVRATLKDPETALKKEPRLNLLWNLPNRDELLVPWALKGLYPGTYRTCAKLADLTQPEVMGALKAGRSFVTNGPLLLVTVNGTDPGSSVEATEATVKYQAVCNRGLERLDFVADGKVVKSCSLKGLVASGEVTLPLQGAHWLTVECYGKWPEFATTNAWYVK